MAFHIRKTEKEEAMNKCPDDYPMLSLRMDQSNPNHHLWNNNGTWYLCVTVHTSAVTSERVRRSLHTGHLDLARSRRDAYLEGVCHV
jgi:hypothetical protein